MKSSQSERISKRMKWISALVVVAWLLVACAGDDSQQAPAESTALPGEPTVTAEPTSTYVVSTPEYGAAPVIAATPDVSDELVTLDIGLVDQVRSLDPQLSGGDGERDVIENLFVGLTRLNQATGEIEPLLAESWTVSPDGRTWTFQLRQDMFWVEPIGSGAVATTLLQQDIALEEVRTVRQVVADDVVYAVQRICDPEVDSPDAFIFYVITGCAAVHQQSLATPADLDLIGVRANGPFTLEVSLTEPASYFLIMTTLPAMKAVPRDIIADTDFGVDWADPEELGVASGPFVLSPVSAADERLVLQRNPFWPLNFTYDFEHAPDVVTINLYDNFQEPFDSWQKRELDVVPLPASEMEMMEDRGQAKILAVPDQSVFYLGYNYDSPIFSDPRLRRAFAAAINREEIIEEVYDGQAIGMRHFTPPDVWGAPGVNEAGLNYDPDFARQQLAESGVRTCAFLPEIRFLISTSDTSLFQAELIRDMWVEELGCLEENIIIEQVQFGTLLANTRSEAGDLRPDIWELGWSSYFPDAHNWLHTVLHCQESDNRQNRPCNEVDQMLKRAETAEPELRTEIYRRVEEEFFSRSGEMPIVPLLVRSRPLVRQTWVGFDPATFGGEQYDTYFIDPEIKAIEQRQ